jgi:predicted O-methyltransferase YrrM
MRKPNRISYQELHMGANYTQDEEEFIKAVDKYKRENNRPFPTLHETLHILKTLGYTKNPKQEHQ